MEFCYISVKKMCDCHETKSKHIDWSQDLKCDHRVWPWPWPWTWIFKVKHGIGYISAKNGPIATEHEANTSIELKASNMTNGFDLGHDLDLEFSRSNMKFAISPIATKRKANISIWTLCLKCGQWIWPWPWPWYLNYQGHMWSWPFGDQGQV